MKELAGRLIVPMSRSEKFPVFYGFPCNSGAWYGDCIVLMALWRPTTYQTTSAPAGCPSARLVAALLGHWWGLFTSKGKKMADATKPGIVDAKAELIAAQRRVWGDAVQLCATCDNEAAPRSCYCDECEAREFGQ